MLITQGAYPMDTTHISIREKILSNIVIRIGFYNLVKFSVYCSINIKNRDRLLYL